MSSFNEWINKNKRILWLAILLAGAKAWCAVPENVDNLTCIINFRVSKTGSVTILGDLTIHANNFATLNKKNFTSATPLKLALNFLILALNDSAFALVSLSSKKLRLGRLCL